MTQDINLKALERKAWLSMFQDGLMEIFFGLMFLILTVRPLLDDIGIKKPWDAIISTLCMLSTPLVYIIGKKIITIPRMGLVKFGPKRQARRKKIIIILLVFIIATNIILILSIKKAFPHIELNGPALYLKRLGAGLVLLALPLSIVAYFLDFKRLYIYGLLAALAESVYVYVGSIGFGITSGIILLTGLVIFFRFLHDYPLPSDDTIEGAG